MEVLPNTTDYEDYNEIYEDLVSTNQVDQLSTGFSWMYVSVYSVTILLGLLLNSAVIFIYIFQKPLTETIFIISLAVTHLVLCLFMPLYLISAWYQFTWIFGDIACKLGSFMVFLNMFSVSMIITFWNLGIKHFTRCLVLLSWIVGAILSCPSLLYRKVQASRDGSDQVCLDRYNNPEDFALTGMYTMKAVMSCRFLFGLLIPVLVACISCCIRKKQDSSPATRPVLIVHFVCWAPILCLSVLQIIMGTYNSAITNAMSPATALSVLNSCISPVICVWAGKKTTGKKKTTGEGTDLDRFVNNI